MDIIELIEQRRISRYFRVKNKLIVRDGVYHVTQRAPGMEKLFLEKSDYLYFLHLLKEILPKFQIVLFAFTLMPNHVHLLLKIEDTNLDVAMQKLFQRYAIYFNMRYKRKGHVVCGNYRCALCNSERYIIAASLYIHANPVKARLIRDIYTYRWSSLNLYAKKGRVSFIDQTFILYLLDANIEIAIQIYKRLLKKCLPLDIGVRLEKAQQWVRIQEKIVQAIDGLYRKKQLSIPQADEDLEKKILLTQGRRRITAPFERTTIMYVIKQLKSRGFNDREIAGILRIHRCKVYRLLKNYSYATKTVRN